MSTEADKMRCRMTQVATTGMRYVYLHNAGAEAIAAIRAQEAQR